MSNKVVLVLQREFFLCNHASWHGTTTVVPAEVHDVYFLSSLYS